MWRTKYTLREVARILRRSEGSLMRDIRAGVFRVTSKLGAHQRGRQRTYEISMKQLERYLGEERAHRLFDKSAKSKAEVAVEAMRDRNTKECRLCGQYKPPQDFTRDGRYTDGLFPYCKECEKRIYGR